MPQGTEAPAGTMAEGPTSHTQIQAAGLAKLRVPFPAEQISPLPKIICGECSRSRTKVCENPRHAKSKCRECENYITQAHMHLDYVGHAELTNRLLEADPLWDWEPLALDQRGLPQFDENGGLWIRLTVCGKTRLGYGDAQGKQGPNAVKEAIGDALRNAAMRFGAALDLWAKSDLREAQTEHPKTAEDDGIVSPRPAAQKRQEAAKQQQPPVGGREPSSRPEKPKESREEALARLTAEYQRCWEEPTALLRIRIDGKKAGVSQDQVQGPPPESKWMTFDELLEARINELNVQKSKAV